MSDPTTFCAWLQETLDPDQIADLAHYGAAAGFPGLTYYRDNDAQDLGYSTPLAFVASLGGSKDVATGGQFANLCVWYLAERTAQQVNGAGQ